MDRIKAKLILEPEYKLRSTVINKVQTMAQFGAFYTDNAELVSGVYY